jgi:hypothetical protein
VRLVAAWNIKKGGQAEGEGDTPLLPSISSSSYYDSSTRTLDIYINAKNEEDPSFLYLGKAVTEKHIQGFCELFEAFKLNKLTYSDKKDALKMKESG